MTLQDRINAIQASTPPRHELSPEAAAARQAVFDANAKFAAVVQKEREERREARAKEREELHAARVKAAEERKAKAAAEKAKTEPPSE